MVDLDGYRCIPRLQDICEHLLHAGVDYATKQIPFGITFPLVPFEFLHGTHRKNDEVNSF